MEKKQVSTFLKILQIPKDAPPADIKESLLASGWNEKDADEAIRVLYPNYTSGTASASDPVTHEPQLVAQRYVKPVPEPEAPQASAEEDTAPVAPEPVPAPVAETSAPDAVNDDSAKNTKEPFDFASVTKAHAEAAEQAAAVTGTPTPEEEAKAEQVRPHTDAPWLENQVDIYDVTEEEKQEMIRTVYRTNERLTPQTIHALLGIDVDLSEYEAAYQRRKRNEVSAVQVAVILLSSLAIAAIALYLGLYYFEVGPFHPSITGGR